MAGKRAAINQRAARDRCATYLAERADIRQRLQRQELEVHRLREEMAAMERERDARRRNNTTPGPLPESTRAANSPAPLPTPAATAHPEDPPIPSTSHPFSTSHLPSRYLAHPRPHIPPPAAGAPHPPPRPHGRGAPPPALLHACPAQPNDSQRGSRIKPYLVG